MARAFRHDPIQRWMFPETWRWAANSHRMFALILEQTVKQGMLLTTRKLEGAALWLFLKKGHGELLDNFPTALRMAPMLGLRFMEIMKGFNSVGASHPKGPHFYLMTLGTAPEHQRKGIGSRLMEPVLKRCDVGGLPAYLEASSRSNIPIYERLGFQLQGELTLPGGPSIYPMLREPGRVC